MAANEQPLLQWTVTTRVSSTRLQHYRLSAVYRRLGRTVDAQREALAFSEIRERKKRIMAAYQQMHQSAGASVLSDPDIPQ